MLLRLMKIKSINKMSARLQKLTVTYQLRFSVQRVHFRFCVIVVKIFLLFIIEI